MKSYELRIKYEDGEIDDYYTRLTGDGWKTDAETAEEALQEMKENDPETFEAIAENNQIEEYWAELISETLFEGYSADNRPVEIILKDGNVLIVYKDTGIKEFWNDEYYTEDSYETIKLSMLNEGFRI